MSGARGTWGVLVVVGLLCLAPVGAAGVAGVGDAGASASDARAEGTATVTDYSVPEVVTLHRNFSVDVTVNNTASTEVEKTVRVERRQDGLWSTVATHNVTVPANAETSVSFNATLHEGPAGETADPAVLRVGGLDPTSVTSMPNAASVNGDVDVELRLLPADARVESTNGDLAVALSPTLDVALDARTTNGDVDVEGLDLRDASASDSSVTGTLGDGTHELVAARRTAT